MAPPNNHLAMALWACASLIVAPSLATHTPFESNHLNPTDTDAHSLGNAVPIPVPPANMAALQAAVAAKSQQYNLSISVGV